MSWEGKKYKLDKQENFEEYMKALGKHIDFFYHAGNLNLTIKKEFAEVH